MSGLEILKLIQSLHSPLLDAFFCFVTNLHHENFYIVVVPLILWLYDKRFGRYLMTVFALGFWANNLLKDSFDTARPPEGEVRKVCAETGTGPAFPSGHAQNPLMFWGALALQLNKRWFTIAAIVVVFLIGYSRLYLGLHWPLDVLGGWAIGLVMLYGFHATQSVWVGTKHSLGQRLLLALGLPLVTLLIHHTGAWDAPGELAGDSWVLTGAYIGFWVGSILEEEYVGFDPRQGGVLAQVLKVVIGVVLLFGVKEAFKVVLPDTALGDLIRYGFVGIMATIGAPGIFRRFITPPPPGRSMVS